MDLDTISKFLGPLRSGTLTKGVMGRLGIWVSVTERRTEVGRTDV